MSKRRLSIPHQKQSDERPMRRVSENDLKKPSADTASFVFRQPQKARSLGIHTV